MTTEPKRRRLLPLLTAGAAAVALAVAGCGGSSSNAATPANSPSAQQPNGPVQGIPQHNGGDHDADNNGGPTDGDGNI